MMNPANCDKPFISPTDNVDADHGIKETERSGQQRSQPESDNEINSDFSVSTGPIFQGVVPGSMFNWSSDEKDDIVVVSSRPTCRKSVQDRSAFIPKIAVTGFQGNQGRKGARAQRRIHDFFDTDDDSISNDSEIKKKPSPHVNKKSKDRTTESDNIGVAKKTKHDGPYQSSAVARMPQSKEKQSSLNHLMAHLHDSSVGHRRVTLSPPDIKRVRELKVTSNTLDCKFFIQVMVHV